MLLAFLLGDERFSGAPEGKLVSPAPDLTNASSKSARATSPPTIKLLRCGYNPILAEALSRA